MQPCYLTDLSNNGTGVLSAKTNIFVGRIGAGLFARNSSTDTTGLNGVSINDASGGKLLVSSDGTSTVRTFQPGV